MKIVKRFRIPLLALSIALVAYTGINTWGGFTLGSGQIVTHGDAAALANNSQIIWTSNPGWATTDGTAMTQAEAGAHVQGCGSESGNTVITNGTLQSCRTLTTIINGTTDPWLTSQGTNWPTQSGTPTFTADSSGLTGEPTGAYSADSSHSSASGMVVWQAINGGATLLANTTITAKAYLEYTTATSGSTLNGCTQATATGASSVEILNSSGVVEASASAASTSWAQYSVSYTVPSGGGVYYVGVSATTQSASGTSYHVSGGCLAAATTYAIGKGIDITVSN